MAVGAFNDYKSPPLAIADHPNNRALLFACFKGLGQHRPILLNANYRASTEYLSFVSGYPVVCEAANQRVVDSIKKPLILLQEAGMELNFTDDLEAIATYSKWFFPKMFKALLSTKAELAEDVLATGLSFMKNLNIDTPDYEPVEGNIVKFYEEGTENLIDGSTATSIPSI